MLINTHAPIIQQTRPANARNRLVSADVDCVGIHSAICMPLYKSSHIVCTSASNNFRRVSSQTNDIVAIMQPNYQLIVYTYRLFVSLVFHNVSS